MDIDTFNKPPRAAGGRGGRATMPPCHSCPPPCFIGFPMVEPVLSAEIKFSISMRSSTASSKRSAASKSHYAVSQYFRTTL